MNRPTCILCSKPAALIRTHKTTGEKSWRKYCSSCHIKRRKNFKEKITHFDPKKRKNCANAHCRKKVNILGTNENGELLFSEFCRDHSSTPIHLQYRKNYCENKDSRLGFKCTTNIYWIGMLQVDHINGNPSDNRPENLQTLCACCHIYKSWKNKDYATAGRKTLRLAKKNTSIK